MKAFLRIAALAALLPLAAAPLAAQTANDVLGTAKDAVDTGKAIADGVKNTPKTVTGAAANAAKDLLPAEAAPIVEGAEAIANGLSDIAGGALIGNVVGKVFDSVGKAVADLSRDTDALKLRVETLESDNAKQFIEIEHQKARITELETKLAQQNAAVTEAMAALDRRLQTLEGKAGTVTAPFKVVDGGGRVLLQVAQDGVVTVGSGAATVTIASPPSGMAEMTLKAGGAALVLAAAPDASAVVQLNSGGRAAALLEARGDEEAATLNLAGGDARADLSAASASAGALALANGTDGKVALSTKTDALGLQVSVGGKPKATLGALDGKGVALRVFGDGGNALVAGGENPAVPGTGILYVGNGSKNLAALSGDDKGGGLASAFAPDGTVGAGLVGAERAVAAYNASGAAVATISKSDKSEGGNVTARNPAGEGVFTAGFASGYGGGEACVWRAKRSNTFCLGLGLPGMGVGK